MSIVIITGLGVVAVKSTYGTWVATSANSNTVKWVSQLTVQLTEIGATGP